MVASGQRQSHLVDGPLRGSSTICGHVCRPVAALFNHSCAPNCVFDHRQDGTLVCVLSFFLSFFFLLILFLYFFFFAQPLRSVFLVATLPTTLKLLDGALKRSVVHGVGRGSRPRRTWPRPRHARIARSVLLTRLAAGQLPRLVWHWRDAGGHHAGSSAGRSRALHFVRQLRRHFRPHLAHFSAPSHP